MNANVGGSIMEAGVSRWGHRRSGMDAMDSGGGAAAPPYRDWRVTAKGGVPEAMIPIREFANEI